MRAMFHLFASMPLLILVSIGLLARSSRSAALTQTEIHNRLRAIVTLVDLLPRPVTAFEITLSQRIEAWLQAQIDELSARLALIEANVIFVGTVPAVHDPTVTREN